MIEALIVMAGIALVLGAGLGFAAVRFRVEGNPIVERLDALLPQTQCGQCGYAGCHPYAEAIARGDADINRCAPGGEAGVKRLAELMGVEPKPLDAEVAAAARPKSLAFIDETSCIGCTLCIQACPVDAIVGAAKQVHTVIAAQCTGCELCIKPCPVDCIEMRPLAEGPAGWRWQYPAADLQKAA